MNIAIIGAGIMGLASAWALARDGHAVTVYDQGPVPNPLGSSVDQHRLIRHTYGAERGYTRMINAAYDAWDLLWADLGARHYAATGTVVLDAAHQWTADTARTLTEEGVPFRRLDMAQFARAYPLLDYENLHAALFLDSGGTLFAEPIIADLARYLPTRGVRLETHAPVRDVDPDRARAVLADGWVIEADLMIVAAGPWAPRLLPELHGRVTPSRQMVLYVAPPADLLEPWLHHPMVLDIDRASGFYLVPPRRQANGRISGLKLGDHTFSLTGDPDRDRIASQIEAEQLLTHVGRRLRHIDRYRLTEAKTCFYDVEPHEKFIVEPRGASGWVLSGFSGHGFKFGAVIGLELARTIRGARTAPDLTAWAAGQLPT
jgi:glycine/D-amino acid oxidase-like deaminating enzyme